MGGVDKGWVEYDGQPLIRRAIERFAPQVDELLISANRSLDRYARLGYTVVSDEVEGFTGPLAGVHAALGSAKHEWLATCPCDSPWLAGDLVSRLWAACHAGAAAAAIACTKRGPEPVFALLRRDLRVSLGDYLRAGGRRVGDWYRGLDHVEVTFSDCGAFRNLNTRDDLGSG